MLSHHRRCISPVIYYFINNCALRLDIYVTRTSARIFAVASLKMRPFIFVKEKNISKPFHCTRNRSQLARHSLIVSIIPAVCARWCWSRVWPLWARTPSQWILSKIHSVEKVPNGRVKTCSLHCDVAKYFESQYDSPNIKTIWKHFLYTL